ncbi:DNA-binding MarR family transcriptional regulator [Streptomyces sp. SAI-135]|jgi:DNA-binding MarR family transcriptional regulator|uniref:MarR family winged helix-turn-helix transcriptional regulator n=1 Tax=unclassified Streptomyces TaxID=2593676 RepID=UPI002476ECCB|nr:MULTISPECIES: MarR family transcriptional regulator [unclassified Streptomyces]MDH6522611.1 DNA-binding MarR family transcriptional regulator [Streptomyces sp. SAI-090]MDH6554234.1 DNA-binding MarR family transcriptional regulator [Streptomyces sp. SAI-041]MDH6573494.1 DNA-binding MarR family transcriptional regulator [Streptomyces sp. SAI-117]MDH6581768.1 DNA-binding MarR family transcriptional regulator [Streptomyces sp. SAI-133]MDH6613771.1 DNA-binding MarR family transcriptional regulat
MPESTAQGAPEDFDEPLTWLLGESFRIHLSVMREAVGDLPHGPRGFQALCEAADPTPRNQAELARCLGLDRTVMVYLIDDLETAGLVERVPDPSDRRSKLIRATPAGTARLRELRKATVIAEAELLADFSLAEMKSLRSLLQRIAARGSRYQQVTLCADNGS